MFWSSVTSQQYLFYSFLFPRLSVLRGLWLSGAGEPLLHCKIQVTGNHHSNHFKAHDSVAFGILAILCKCHHYLVLEHLHHPKGNLMPIKQSLPVLAFLQSPETTNLLSVSIDFAIQDIS